MMVSYAAGPYSQPQIPWNMVVQPTMSYCQKPACNGFGKTVPAQKEDNLSHREWPWRILPFFSDLGTVGYLINRPKLGLLGWLVATPYYLYALCRQPNTKARKEEALYQSTANGVFPALEAKLGVVLGGLLHAKVGTSRLKTSLVGELTRQSETLYKLLGGLSALTILTPTLGDPMSHWLGQQYQTSFAKGVNR